jgi:putative addiction module CopG family antidote
MVINVPADLAERIRQKVASGGYYDESDVIRVALRLLDARDRAVRELRESVVEGLAALERGEGREWTPELMDELDRRADEQLRLDLSPKPDVCP